MFEDLTVNRKTVTYFVFKFSWFSFFAFWGTEMHVFKIVPFRPTRYVLKIFRYLDVSNRVKNWSKVKNNMYVRRNFYNINWIYQYSKKILICQFSLKNSVSFMFCEFNRVSSWNEGKTVILVRSSFQIPK